MTRAEFYIGKAAHPIASVKNVGAVPVVGQLINIMKVTYSVVYVSWAVDGVGTTPYNPDPELRCCVTLALPKPKRTQRAT